MSDSGSWWWRGYQAVGVAFASGHVLTYRRFRGPAGGPGLSSVWIHHPRRGWTVLTDGHGEAGWERWARIEGGRIERTCIEATWVDGRELTVRVPSVGLAWVVHTDASGWAVRALNGLGRGTGLWRVPLVRGALSRAAGALMGCGALPLEGRTPSGARVAFLPKELRAVPRSVALLEGRHLGMQVLLERRPALGGLRMPRSGVFLAGTERFGDVADASRAQSSCE